MNCPVCDRSLAPTLSICPSCGAMMNDTVREELQSKIIQGPPPKREVSVAAEPSMMPIVPAAAPKAVQAPKPAAPERRKVTTDLAAAPTSPTLVGFQSPKTTVPEWRLQLQNSVQQRRNANPAAEDDKQFRTVGSAALKADAAPAAAMPEIANPTLAKALRRIDESRQTYFEAPAPKRAPAKPAATPRPFGVVQQTASTPAQSPLPRTVRPVIKPTLVPDPPALEKRDTNKLPRLEVVTNDRFSAELPPIEEPKSPPFPMINTGELGRIEIKAAADNEASTDWDETDDAGEDIAPFSMRFGAGLFDLIATVFATMLVLSPLAFTQADWFSLTSLLVFVATALAITFIYTTACIGFYGKTLGMRLFSLELVDAVQNEYPTLRQAAISSFVFLGSFIFAGSGFVWMYFNKEKRALHDLASGTILVREF